MVSQEGYGTAFEIYLPATEKEAENALKTAPKASNGKETILLVDDEVMITGIGKEMLSRLGYEVRTAKGGQEAIEIYQREPGAYDMVILDLIMPGLSGGETYDKLKLINPDIKVLISSGYSVDGEASKVLDRGCNGFIQKPFRLDELCQKIRSVLD